MAQIEIVVIGTLTAAFLLSAQATKPSCSTGASPVARNGLIYQLTPGDVIVIPAGVGHWFTRIGDHIQYLMVRIDPDRMTPLKDAAASKADLAGK